MSSDSLLVNCKACGKEIFKSSKSCSQCGAKQRKLSIFHIFGAVLFSVIIIAVILGTQEDAINQSSNLTKQANSSSYQVPEQQLRFIESITNHTASFNKALNELQQASVREQRKLAISSSLKSYVVNSWVGTINKLTTNTDGDAILSIRIAKNIDVKTWNNSLSDMTSNTIIKKETPVYRSLINLSTGQRVKFSGSFFPSKKDHVEELSMTISGSMREPEFLFKFNSITPIE